ncbi:hypothetical protein [Gelidibacter salicanalis]|uniref:Uncharacterized protein n=1 Tax=Gelidibacter salicanalis TaxID=291193 RepID=A0A934KJP7_9FLAO|nr:hypothetical protein [Gelidibacter salicanalis]MBJ7880312.1 hypothetical protein [Gelidibacter salicanalis]
MKNLMYVLIFVSTSLLSQERIATTALKTVPLKADQLITIDNFGTLFYALGNTFYKTSPEHSYTYSNVQLGPITSANVFNPLKINVFYKNFNTVMILDNRLSEIYKIDFNTIQPYKNITHVSTGYDNTIWIFNQDIQQLELFDFRLNQQRATTMPVQSKVLDLKSNYNYSWLLTENFLYTYNYFGSTVAKMKNEKFLKIAEDNGNLIIQTKKGLFYLPKNTDQPVPIQLPEMLIKQFLVTNESLYIYADETLYQFQLKLK